jgi:hypothetical protein
MRKGTSRAFRKCGSFRDLEVLNHVKVRSNVKKKMSGEGGVKKNRTATVLSFGRCR